MEVLFLSKYRNYEKHKITGKFVDEKFVINVLRNTETNGGIESRDLEQRLMDHPIQFQIGDDNLTIFVKSVTNIDSFRQIEGVEINTTGVLENYDLSIIIKNPRKEHAKIINTIDEIVGYKKSSVLDLEKTQLTFKQKMYAHFTSLVTELHPRHLARTVLKHGPWLGTALLAGTIIDHALLPYLAITIDHLEILGITLFHLPEIMSVAIYSVGRKIYSNITQKTSQYGNDLDHKIRTYLQAIKEGNHQLCESMEVKMERDLHIDMSLGGKTDIENMNLIVNHGVDYLQSADITDLSVVRILSNQIRTRLKDNYDDWKAYISAIAIEHMAEFTDEEFGAKELVRYKVFRDNVIHILTPDHYKNVSDGLADRLLTHISPGKSHDSNCPCYAIARGDVYI